MPNSLAAQDSPSHTHGRLDHEAVGLASPSSMEGVFHKVTLRVKSSMAQSQTGAVGPALEVREGLQTLMEPAAASMSLVSKSTSLAGKLLESTGLTGRGEGSAMAMKLLTSGKAYEKFKEIVEARGGNPRIRSNEIQVGGNIYELIAHTDGYVTLVENTLIADIARAAGAPYDRGQAWLYTRNRVQGQSWRCADEDIRRYKYEAFRGHIAGKFKATHHHLGRAPQIIPRSEYF